MVYIQIFQPVFKIAKPEIRWFPAEESLREKGAYEKLLAPL